MSVWYYSRQQRYWFYTLRTFAFLVLAFLSLPALISIPLSFNVEPFFYFTKKMLQLDPSGYSLKWYLDVFRSQEWMLAIQNTFVIGLSATLIASLLGVLASLGLHLAPIPGRQLIVTLLLSPMIVPLIITAAGTYFFYSVMDMTGTYTSLILSHAALGTPFVLLSVNATLVNFDKTLVKASASLGAHAWYTFVHVTLPLIRPGVISGTLLAFMVSFDEVVLVLFLAGPFQRTITTQMFTGLREEINPSILAVGSLLIVFSVVLLCVMEYLRRKSTQ